MWKKSCHLQISLISKFPEGHNEVPNLTHAQVLPTAVRNIDICHSEEPIFRKRRLTVHDTASNSGISVRSVQTIIH
jgi:hypothetical protein